MIIPSAKGLRNVSPIKNCRVQSLCNLLNIRGVETTPQLLYLICPKPLYFYSDVSYGKISFPFLGSFYPDIENRLLNETGLNYGIGPSEFNYSEICSVLDNGDPRILLCDADSVMRRQRDSEDSPQIGVCSSIVVVGYDDKRNIYFPHPTLSERYESISFDLLSYARNRIVFPSSPLSTSIWVEANTAEAENCSEILGNYDYAFSMLAKQMRSFAESPKEASAQYTNNGTPYFTENGAVRKLSEFFDSVQQMIGNGCLDEKIQNKIFVLKLMMLRKSMISGTNTFNRVELADSIHALYQIRKSSAVKELHLGFKRSAKTYRHIIRMLYFSSKRLDDKEKYLEETRGLFNEAIGYERRIIYKFLNAAC